MRAETRIERPAVGSSSRVCRRHAAPIEGAVLDRFGNVWRCDLLLSRQIGNGASQSQNAVVSACGKAQLLNGAAQKILAHQVNTAEVAYFARTHVCIGKQVGLISK